MIPLIIDCDPGIDDALALMVAAASPELELLAVTTVAGNRPVATTSMNACRVLDAAGRDDVPVYAGCARPLAQATPRSGEVHGADGLGGVALPARRQPLPEHATGFLAKTLLAEPPGSITLAAVGPLTNLALIEIQHPGILRRARSLRIMGGAAFRPGNITPSAEFNFHADPLAAHVVLSAGADIQLFGLDVTSKTEMSEAWIDALGLPGSRCGRAAHDMLRGYQAVEPRLHDACPIVHLLAPTIFSGERCALAVDWRPGPTEGHAMARRASRCADPAEANAIVFTDVDAQRLLELVHERIRRLP